MFLTVSITSAQIYKFRVYATEDGLRNLAVLSMIQDHDGYVWAGTLNGLYRYDGDRFERMGAEHGFLQSQIVSLAVTPDGSIWAGTATGLAVFREHTFEAVHFPEAVTLESQSSLAVDPATDALWVATKTGLASIESSSYRRGSPKAIFASFAPHATISAVSFGADGSIWFGSGGSLFQYERKSGVSTRFGSSAGVPNDIWDAILSDGEGRLWARSATRLISLRKGENQFHADRLPTAEFGALALRRNGNVAIPTVKGLAIRDRNGWKVLGTKSGLPMDSVSTFFVDREGSPWIGTNGGGVARWLGFGAWENWTAPAWLEDDAIWSIAEDHSGDIWVGSNTGIMKMTQGGQAVQAPARNRLRFGDVVRSMAVGEANDLWAGTEHHGLFHCNLASEHCDPVGEESGLHSPSVGGLALDSSGILWVTSGDGVYFGNAHAPRIHFEPLHVDGLPPGEHPGTLFIGPHRELLAGTHGGLWISRNGTWSNIGRAQGLLDDDVNQIAADQVGNIYVTYRKPLGVSQIRLMPGGGVQIKHLTEQNEVRSNYIYTLGTDARNNLWAGTDSGIERLAGGRWRHYGTANGLIWADLNSNAFFADSRHGLWFGTSRGLAHYQPDLDTSASAAPQPLVTKLVVDGRTEDSGHSFVVPYRNRDVTMRFSTLSFLDEIDTHFEYRVVGLLDDWRASTGRDLQLLKLPAGSYSLEVLATTPNSGKSSHPTRLQFVVETPWWQTRMFELLSALLIISGIAAIYRWRTTLRRRETAKLERRVEQRTAELSEAMHAAENAAVAKADFLATMSHEIRTPMHGVLGTLDLLSETGLTAQQNDYLDTARNSSRSLLALLNDILDLSKIGAGRMQLHVAPFSLRQTATEVTRLLDAQASIQEIALSLSYASGLPEYFEGDEMRIRQIVLNLAGNALKFTPQGQVTIEISGRQKPDGRCSLTIAVRDTGIGIPPDRIPQLFQDFVQINSAASRRFAGSGLGLAICQRLATMMGGSISVESEPGRGSTFSLLVELPQAVPLVQPNEVTEPIAVNRLFDANILLAEDNRVNQKLAISMLTRLGCGVTLAQNGREAVELAEQQRFRIIFMDCQMPEMDGFEASRLIRSKLGDDLVIIAMTANALPGDRERCIQAGMNDYLAKPFQRSDLVRLLNRYLPYVESAGTSAVPEVPTPL